jgi:hypothetical protein
MIEDKYIGLGLAVTSTLAIGELSSVAYVVFVGFTDGRDRQQFRDYEEGVFVFSPARKCSSRPTFPSPAALPGSTALLLAKDWLLTCPSTGS